MRNPITSSPRFGDYNSFNKLALKLIQTRAELFGKPGKDQEVAVRSLGAKIGELDRGKTTWWLKREAQTQALVDLLEIDRDELGLHQKSGPHIYPLAAFPDFPPIDLMRENYWSIAKPELLSGDAYEDDNRFSNRPTLDAWLFPHGRQLYRDKAVEWLHVPDATEYQLLVGKLKAAGRHHVLVHDSVREVIAHDIYHVRNPQALILAIHGVPEVDHLLALAAYRQGEPLLVISPSPMPNLWEEQDGGAAKPHSADEKPALAPNQVRNWTWTMLPDWRWQLFDWLEQRLNRLGVDTFFSSEAAQKVLDKFDPSGKWFISVEDVLVLCQAISEMREAKLQVLAGSDGDLEELLSLLFERDKIGLKLIQPLVVRRWERWDLPWEGELDQQVWAELARGLCPFATLLDQQLIVQGAKNFDFQRPILIRLLLRSQLLTALTGDNLAAWAPACFDNQRRPLVDAALDVLDVGQLEKIASQLLEAPACALTVGAGEAMFAAVGRRIIREEDIGSELPLLAAHVIRQLSWDRDLLYPCSRPVHTMAQQLEWIGICWAWSLVPAPGVELAPSWFFPGWSPVLPASVPNWLNHYASSAATRHWEHMAIPMRDFLSVVTRWLARHEEAPVYENMPLLFNAGLLARAAAGQWPASEHWWWGLLGQPIPEQTLLRQVESADPAVNRRTALAWWPSLVKNRQRKFKESFMGSRLLGSNLFSRSPKEQGYSALLSWVMEQMDRNGEQALNGLDDEDRKFLIQHPAALSTQVKRQLLRSLASDFPKDWHVFEFANLFLHYGPETAVEMEAFLDSKELGDQAAGYLWQWAPHKAELLMRKQRVGREALRRLLQAAPLSAIGSAVELLNEEPALLGADALKRWARYRLPDARQYAQDLLHFLNSTNGK